MKKERLFTILAILLLLVIIVLAITTLQEEKKLDHVEEYTIQSGESLWSIASEYKPSNMSIQEYIYNLKEYNNIGSMVYANQTIQILYYEEV